MSFKDYLKIAYICNLLFAAPCLFILLVLGRIDLYLAGFFLITFFLLKGAVLAVFGWLVDKGSNGENGVIAQKAIGGVTGIFYGVLLGGLVSINSLPQPGIVLLTITLFILGLIGGLKLGPIVGERVRQNPSKRPVG